MLELFNHIASRNVVIIFIRSTVAQLVECWCGIKGSLVMPHCGHSTRQFIVCLILVQPRKIWHDWKLVQARKIYHDWKLLTGSTQENLTWLKIVNPCSTQENLTWLKIVDWFNPGKSDMIENCWLVQPKKIWNDWKLLTGSTQENLTWWKLLTGSTQENLTWLKIVNPCSTQENLTWLKIVAWSNPGQSDMTCSNQENLTWLKIVDWYNPGKSDMIENCWLVQPRKIWHDWKLLTSTTQENLTK